MTLSLDGKPKTLMATTIELFGGGTTRLPRPRTRVSCRPQLRHSDAIRVLVNPFIDMGMKDVTAREGDPGKRAMMKKAIDAVGPTLKAGVVDFHIAAGTPKSGGNYNVLAALGVQGGDKIESTVRDLVGQIPAGDRAKITTDVTKVNGANVHQLKIENLDADAKRLFGSGVSAWAASARPRSCSASAATRRHVCRNDHQRLAEARADACHRRFARQVASLDKNPSANQIAGQVFGPSAGSDHFRLSVNGGKLLKLDLSFKGRGVTFLQQLNEKKGGS